MEPLSDDEEAAVSTQENSHKTSATVAGRAAATEDANPAGSHPEWISTADAVQEWISMGEVLPMANEPAPQDDTAVPPPVPPKKKRSQVRLPFVKSCTDHSWYCRALLNK